MRILVTRPIAQALKTKERLEAFGHDVCLAPMLEIVFPACSDIDPGQFRAIAVTSLNAIDALLQRADRDQLQSLPMFTVGDKSARQAERAGWQQVTSASGTVDDLVALLASKYCDSTGSILYAAGVNRAGDLAGGLATQSVEVVTAEVYHARPVDHLASEIVDKLRQDRMDAIFIYSARTALIFLQCVRNVDLLAEVRRIRTCVLSEAIAAPFRAAGFENMTVATEPNESSLLKDLRFQG